MQHGRCQNKNTLGRAPDDRPIGRHREVLALHWLPKVDKWQTRAASAIARAAVSRFAELITVYYVTSSEATAEPLRSGPSMSKDLDAIKEPATGCS